MIMLDDNRLEYSLPNAMISDDEWRNDELKKAYYEQKGVIVKIDFTHDWPEFYDELDPWICPDIDEYNISDYVYVGIDYTDTWIDMRRKAQEVWEKKWRKIALENMKDDPEFSEKELICPQILSINKIKRMILWEDDLHGEDVNKVDIGGYDIGGYSEFVMIGKEVNDPDVIVENSAEDVELEKRLRKEARNKVIIPHELLEELTLRKIIRKFVILYGEDKGDSKDSLAEKIALKRCQLRAGDVFLVYNKANKTINIVPKEVVKFLAAPDGTMMD